MLATDDRRSAGYSTWAKSIALDVHSGRSGYLPSCGSPAYSSAEASGVPVPAAATRICEAGRVCEGPGDKTHSSCSGRQSADRLGYVLLAVPDHPLDQA